MAEPAADPRAAWRAMLAEEFTVQGGAGGAEAVRGLGLVPLRRRRKRPSPRVCVPPT